MATATKTRKPPSRRQCTRCATSGDCRQRRCPISSFAMVSLQSGTLGRDRTAKTHSHRHQRTQPKPSTRLLHRRRERAASRSGEPCRAGPASLRSQAEAAAAHRAAAASMRTAEAAPEAKPRARRCPSRRASFQVPCGLVGQVAVPGDHEGHEFQVDDAEQSRDQQRADISRRLPSRAACGQDAQQRPASQRAAGSQSSPQRQRRRSAARATETSPPQRG